MKLLCISTNYNNKLENNSFIHIDLAPATPIPESKLLESEFIIQCRDNSHPPVRCRITDLMRLPLSEITEELIQQSHNMPGLDFILYFLNKNYSFISEKNLTMQTIPVAVYYYEKIHAPAILQAAVETNLLLST